MQGLPIKVMNVTVYAYINPLEPLTEVVLEGSSGTYSVGTLGLQSFYNLNLSNEGKKDNPLIVHSRYYATGETQSGAKFTTPWMFCLNNSDQPQFGRTISFLSSHTDAPEVGLPVVIGSEFITLAPLTDITVSQLFPAPAIGQRTLISNGKGNIIATKIGTPHEMGIQVDSGDRFGGLLSGAKNIIISGKTKEGDLFSQTGYTVISGGTPAIFLKEFFG
jgi:hypothetical protein